jgi:hypothetical protein
MATTLLCVLVAVGCSNGGGSPATPASGDLTGATASTGAKSQTHLWGYYDVYIDIPSQTVEAVPNRDVMFAANVVQFLNGNPANLAFNIIGTPATADYVDVDIDVSITHPFPGLHEYDGYDVRGIFLGDGSKGLKYKATLKYAAYGASDQVMYDYDETASDTHAGKVGNPDGYSRWWNPSEFATPGLFGYTPGLFASTGFTGTAKVNPYKYFADGLDVEDALWGFLTTTTDNGVFAAGSNNTRNYYLRFPMPAPGVKYGYAVVANWIDETTHPANGPEAMALKTEITPDIWYQDATHKGGNLKLDVSVFDWFAPPAYNLYVESSVLSALHTATPSEMTPTGGTSTYSTYHFDIPADNITGTNGNQFWVIVEEQQYNYVTGVPNSAGNDKLAAFFRYDLFVSPTSYNQPPVCDLVVVTEMPVSGWSPVPVVFDASGSSDPNPGDVLTYEWDFDGDGVYGESPDDDYTGTAINPTHAYTVTYVGNVNLKVTDNKDAFSICTAAVDVTVIPSKNIALRSGVTPKDLGIDHGDGDLLILYNDGQVWRYLASGSYQSGSMFYSSGSTAPEFIDVNTNGDSIIAGNKSGTSQYGRSFNSAGSPLSQLPTSYCTQVADVGAITSSSGYSGYHMIMSSGSPIGWSGYQWINWLPSPSYQASGGNLYPDAYGAGNLYLACIQGFEFSKNTMDRCWYLEGAPEFRLEAYTTSRTYAGQQVGGTQSDGMTGFNKPMDVTRDNNNNVYVLDILSTGAPLVKKYSSSLSAVGSFGNSTTISGTPLRIEGSNFNGNIMVLHTNGLSIFFPSEIP